MKKISESTINRLSRYYRTLGRLIDQNVDTINSDKLALLDGITSAQVRKDLSFFGSFGKRGLGYKTKELKQKIGEILGLNKTYNVALVGIGNIGLALIDYNEFKTQGFHIRVLFDNDNDKIGKVIKGLRIKHIDSLCNELQRERIDIGILAVPANAAQDVVNKMITCGVRGFLNFAPVSIHTPDHVIVRNENMSIELEAISYYLNNR